MTHGPLEEEVFAELPEKQWTLLVQGVDSLEPSVNQFMHQFRFIPNWRLEDIMISYATDGGGVGPHFDYYDVFLIQAKGQRRWRIGQKCDSNSALVNNLPMKILSEFETQNDWTLSSGDLLYVPAQVAHWGEAIGECMTYSVGFRAPSHSDFLLDYSAEVASQLQEDQRYRDPEISASLSCSEIPATTFKYFSEQLEKLNDIGAISRWFGEYSTTLKHDIVDHLYSLSTGEMKQERVQLNSFCRAAFVKENESALCFINGKTWQCSVSLATMLSSYTAISFAQLNQHDQQTLLELNEHALLTTILATIDE